jgi:hypothetical protein
VNLNYVTRFNKTNELLVELSNGKPTCINQKKEDQCDYSKENNFSSFVSFLK